VSGRNANWLDVDGSVNQLFPGSKVNIGSNFTGADWWRYNDQCVNTQWNWVCPMSPGDDKVSLVLHWAGTAMENGIGTTYCSNGPVSSNYVYLPCPIGAYVTHFNRNEANAFGVAVMGRITGPVIAASGGWFIRFPSGTPNTISFTDMQIDHGTVLHVAIPYPSATTFNIYAQAPTWCQPGTPPYKTYNSICVHPYRSVNSIAEVISSWGDTYYFDSTNQMLHIRIISMDSFSYQFATNGTYAQYAVWNSTSTYSTYFSRGGVDLLVTGSSFWAVVIQATSSNCQPNCPPLPNVQVPGVGGYSNYSGPSQTPTNFSTINYYNTTHHSMALRDYPLLTIVFLCVLLLFVWN